jgi:hypothetical protein
MRQRQCSQIITMFLLQFFNRSQVGLIPLSQLVIQLRKGTLILNLSFGDHRSVLSFKGLYRSLICLLQPRNDLVVTLFELGYVCTVGLLNLVDLLGIELLNAGKLSLMALKQLTNHGLLSVIPCRKITSVLAISQT